MPRLQINVMKQNFVALLSGAIFGVGLGLSQMIDRDRILGFLDFWGQWDPTLAFVMGGAVIVTLVAFRFVLRRAHPILAAQFFVPTHTRLDRQLILGAALFGVGWGIAGYCPGPAIVATVLGMANPFIFLGAMLVGSLGYQRWQIQGVRG